MRTVILAVDVGTSSTRAALIDQDLNVLSTGVCVNEVDTPMDGRVEQDPAALFASVLRAGADALRGAPDGARPDALIIDTALHSLVPLDPAGHPLGPLMIWADTRAKAQADAIAEAEPGPGYLYRRTGCPLHASYWPAKIAWLKDEEPDLFQRTATFASMKGYLINRLTQPTDRSSAVRSTPSAIVEDMSSATGTGLFNIAALDWDEKATAAAGLEDDRRLPRVVEPRAVVGGLHPDAAVRWGLESIPVIAGGTDGPLANVGAGCVDAGQMTITIGTSAAVRMMTKTPEVHEGGGTWCYYVSDGTWTVGGAINGGGHSLDWLINAFPREFRADQRAEAYRLIDSAAARIAPGAEGLLIAPYFTGERSLGWQEDARGYAVGLNPRHGAAHFSRAIMEGIACHIAQLVTGVQEAAGPAKELRVTGGFLQSQTWSQILADVLGRELLVPTDKEGSLIGSAALGLSAIRPEIDWRQLGRSIGIARRIEPDQKSHARYTRLTATHKTLYHALQPHFSTVVRLAEDPTY